VLTEAEVRAAHPGPLCRELTVVARTVSTNDDLLAAARSGAAEGRVIVAEEQTGGRGRRGRAWHSPPGANLYLSVLLRPGSASAAALPPLSLVAGLAVAEAVAELAPEIAPRLKWPNDVLVGGRKLAGILNEAVDCPGSGLALVVGVGLNVNQEAFPDELREIATSLRLETGRPHVRAPLAAAVLRRLHACLAQVGEEGLAPLLSRWASRSSTLGRRVRCQDGPEGVATGLAPDGALLVTDDAGTLHQVGAGLVEER
jgi:BirA family biotin operon repressor/biotin-[acetyl-CoA-carboxylase] ligase